MTGNAQAVQPDADVVRAVLEGDREAFEDLVARYQRTVWATCWAILGDAHLAQDATQDVFLAAFRQLGSLRRANSFGSWLLTITRRQANRVRRQRKATRLLQMGHEPVAPQAEPFVATDKRWSKLLAALERLPERERVIITLRFFDGHEVGAIARMTGRPIGTVTKQLSRSYERLRRALRKEMEE